MKYSAELIGLISFAAIFGGVLVGRFVARHLPGHHLSSETIFGNGERQFHPRR